MKWREYPSCCCDAGSWRERRWLAHHHLRRLFRPSDWQMDRLRHQSDSAPKVDCSRHPAAVDSRFRNGKHENWKRWSRLVQWFETKKIISFPQVTVCCIHTYLAFIVTIATRAHSRRKLGVNDKDLYLLWHVGIEIAIVWSVPIIVQLIRPVQRELTVEKGIFFSSKRGNILCVMLLSKTKAKWIASPDAVIQNGDLIVEEKVGVVYSRGINKFNRLRVAVNV